MTSLPPSSALSRELPSLEAIRIEKARRLTNQRETTDLNSSRKRCRSLAGFVREAWPVLLPDVAYVHGWHIDMLCDHLEAITRGHFLAQQLDNRLLINEPPGTMKSLLVVVFYPAWEWGPCGMRHLQTIATSFRDDACARDSRRFRTLVRSEWFQSRWPTPLVIENEGHIENVVGGFRKAIPFGSLMGARADRLLIDDPHPIDVVESEADRERAIMRFRESATLRLNNPKASAIIVIMQRLHQRDISGIIDELRLAYVHVMLPMRFEPERACVTPFGKDRRTRDGELLFPERFPLAVVERDERAMTAYAIAGQHQQRPTPRGGLIFKRSWFALRGAAPGDCRRVRGWDLAASEKEKAAFTAGVRLAYDVKARH